ncbi:uncharacterized protein L969DRAFT_48833 [Mixia osmundae IAM 14324]|uniref:DNA-directed RNA polymerase III subunit RPC9 n=1 Tax=Mixia osmundae (strain CBS 9802 / IAM 14324 / JCM 22182 / KY 12970) TaxID=764103 RepID=G7DVV6_MIXOS|nr:uncharacterized protein L969DRAFT_48833 [Mixia osmundae IAM 14324]KEI39605.1 hypothetical protein L969DRAFT_48833 [Mixia osmundae IAM 14324]GAA94716.1 hypothetical protein E5Q_01369 [Mixia osmundae IAM 14324]
MSVLEPIYGLLSDYEVLHQLKREKDAQRAQIDALSLATPETVGQIVSSNAKNIQYQIMAYLLNTAVSDCSRMDEEGVKRIVSSLNVMTYEGRDRPLLSRREKLSLLNTCPRSPAGLSVCIEDLADRLSEDQMTEILELIGANLSSEPILTQEAPTQSEAALLNIAHHAATGRDETVITTGQVANIDATMSEGEEDEEALIDNERPEADEREIDEVGEPDS